ncbi:MAG: hypothetical protein WBM17_09270, partial [Anaerolineales bacterium]
MSFVLFVAIDLRMEYERGRRESLATQVHKEIKREKSLLHEITMKKAKKNYPLSPGKSTPEGSL